jgi:hypothetical protein
MHNISLYQQSPSLIAPKLTLCLLIFGVTYFLSGAVAEFGEGEEPVAHILPVKRTNRLSWNSSEFIQNKGATIESQTLDYIDH